MDQDEAKQIESVEQATQIAQPVQQAISLPVDQVSVGAEVDFDCRILVPRVGCFCGRELVPRAGHVSPIGVSQKMPIVGVPELKQGGLVAQQVLLDARVEPVWLSFVELIVNQLRLADDGRLAVLILNK